MGQAKQRGTREQRCAEAVEKIEQHKPAQINCKRCQAALSEIETVDARRMPGIELLFRAHCSACNYDTWAINGSPEAVAAFNASMRKLTRGQGSAE